MRMACLLKSLVTSDRVLPVQRLFDEILESGRINWGAARLTLDPPEITRNSCCRILRNIATLWYFLATGNLKVEDCASVLRPFRRRRSLPFSYHSVKREMSVLGLILPLRLFQEWRLQNTSFLKRSEEIHGWEFVSLAVNCPKRSFLTNAFLPHTEWFQKNELASLGGTKQVARKNIIVYAPIEDAMTLLRPLSVGSLKLYALPSKMHEDLDPLLTPQQRMEVLVENKMKKQITQTQAATTVRTTRKRRKGWGPSLRCVSLSHYANKNPCALSESDDGSRCHEEEDSAQSEEIDGQSAKD